MKKFKEILTEAIKLNKNLQRVAMANFTSPVNFPPSVTSANRSKQFDPITSQEIQNIDPSLRAKIISQARKKYESNTEISGRNKGIIDLVGQNLENNPDLTFNVTRLSSLKKAAYNREAQKYGYYQNPVQGSKQKIQTPAFTHELIGVMGRAVQNRMGGVLPHHGSYTY
jgi:hypothetical protein